MFYEDDREDFAYFDANTLDLVEGNPEKVVEMTREIATSLLDIIAECG